MIINKNNKLMLEQISYINKINTLYDEWAKQQNINYNLLAILYTVYINKTCTQKEISEDWFIAKQTINTLCKDLIAKNILAATTNENNKREKILSLTDEGINYAKPIVEKLITIENNACDIIGEETIKKMIHDTRQFYETLEQEFNYE